MRRIILWKGYHSEEVFHLIEEAWRNEDLLILYPPKCEDISFLNLLPEGDIVFAGEWEHEPKIPPTKLRQKVPYPENPIYGIFSTGTIPTASRKLILYSKKNIESSLDGILNLFEAEKIDSIFCYPQPFHTFGLILGYLQSLLYGRKLVCLEGPYHSEQHQAWLENISSGTLSLGTPTHFKDLLSFIEAIKIVPDRSYASIIGAALVERELWRDCQKKLNILKPSIGYGATEASPGVTHLSPGVEPKEDGEVGLPLAHLKVSEGKGGVTFSGDSVCLARIENGKLEFPKSITLPDHLEKRSSDGVLIYRGRTELVLNRGGEKYNLEEIEGVLRRQLKIESVCVALPDARLGEELGILVNTKVDGSSVYALLKKVYGRDFCSRNFQVTSDFPSNASSKIDREGCKERLAQSILGNS